MNEFDQGWARINRKLSVLGRVVAWWRIQNALANAHCQMISRQRSADYKEYLIWKGIIK